MKKTQVMAVLNVTPDSFYDGGRYASVTAAQQRAQEMMAEGADWIDLGAESSRPGSDPIGEQEEWRRLAPILEFLPTLGASVSVDTYHAETARRALSCGAAMINDITALQGDPAMAQVVAEAGCVCVLMHMQGSPKDMQQAPQYEDVVDEVCRFFEKRISFAQAQGIAREKLWLDPGFGFGKTVRHNLQLLQRLEVFKQFGLPVLVGTSNKSTIGAVLNAPVDERMAGTAATVAIAVAHGADCVRVHDVKTMAQVVRMSDAIVQGGCDEHG